MKHRVALVEIALALSFSLIVATDLSAKDINLGWSGQGSWSTLPYIVAGERGFDSLPSDAQTSCSPRCSQESLITRLSCVSHRCLGPRAVSENFGGGHREQ